MPPLSLHPLNCIAQNQVMRTIGFNWGAAGLGTSLWSGPLLSTVLRAAGVPESETWGHHCEMIGYEDLPNKVRSSATSQTL